MTPAVNLRKAAALLRERGWCQGEYERAGRVCLMGAVNCAVNGDPQKDTSLDAPEDRALGAALGHCALIKWNDDHDRTADEVIALLEKAADLAEASS